MSASERLREMHKGHSLVLPVFRKSGSIMLGADAFTRARDIESVLDALPELIAVVEAAEQSEDVHWRPDMREALAALEAKLS